MTSSTTTTKATNPLSRASAGPDPERWFSMAKITHPKASGVFPRERLFRVLDECRESPIVWVSAPAGSGKTTLVASYLAERKLNSIWYRVDEGDGDIATFFYYMSLAAKKAAPRTRKPLPLLTPEYLLGVKTFTLRYFEDLFSRLKPSSVIVFDNYQHVQTQSTFHEVICNGLDVLPDGINAIIISREDPPPQFARLRVNGKINLLQGEDIRFNLDETKEMIRLKGFQDISDSSVHRIHERTLGWAAGLALMTEHSTGENFIDKTLSAHTPQEIFDYFATEIFDKTDPEKQEFLLKTSFLPWMTVRIAEQLTGSALSEDILTTLHRNHFFTERDTGADPVYRYHPLFREFLLSRARGTLTREGVVKIQRTAASLYLEADQPDEAASFFIDARDWEGFVPFVLDNAPLLKLQGRIKTLGKWLGVIPAEITGNSPWLLYWRGQCALAITPTEGRAYLEQAFQLFDEQGEDAGALLTWIGIVDALIFSFEDLKPLDRWIDWLNGRAMTDFSFPSPEIESDVASDMVMALMWRRPDRLAMGQWMDKALSSSQICHEPGVRLLVLRRALNYYTWIGDKKVCLTILDELARMTESHQAHPVHMIFDKVIKANYYAWVGDESDLAIKLVEEGFALAEETGIHIADPFLAIQGASAALNKGDDGELLKYIRRLEAVLHQGGSYVGFYYDFVSLRNQVIGKFAEALAFATKMLEKFNESGMPFPESWARMLISGSAYEIGDISLAGKELNVCMGFFQQAGSAYFEFTTWLMKAYFLFTQGNPHLGAEALGRAMKLGRQKGYTNTTLYRKETLSFLCARALESGIEAEYAREFIRRRRLAPPSSAAEHDGWPWPVKIYTLGRFEVLIDGKALEFSGKAPRRVISLLKLLLARGEGGAGEEQLADILWPDSDGDAAHRSFAITLHRLRQLLGNEKALQLRDGVLKIDPKICWVDAHAFEELFVLAEKKSAEDWDRLYEKALSLYQGPFLKGSDDVWVISSRERLRNRYLRAVQLLGERMENTGQYDRAVDLYRKGLETDILAEEMYRRLMKCHQATGKNSEAAEVYDRCRKMLRYVLGIEPSRETEAIYRAIDK
jgi:LuxR family transcriptional regulator, maltose regulon positive regulatory protein